MRRPEPKHQHRTGLRHLGGQRRAEREERRGCERGSVLDCLCFIYERHLATPTQERVTLKKAGNRERSDGIGIWDADKYITGQTRNKEMINKKNKGRAQYSGGPDDGSMKVCGIDETRRGKARRGKASSG